jgi:hypothetical protein
LTEFTENLRVTEIKMALDMIAQALDRAKIEEIAIDAPGYFYITSRSAFDVYGNPEIALGQFDECIALIRGTLTENIPMSYSFLQAIAAVFIYLSERPPDKFP